MYIRKAILKDANEIAKVHVSSWHSTYQTIIPKEYLKNLSHEKRTKQWRFNISNEGSNIFVALDNEGKVAGFADCRDGNKNDHSGELTSIYLLKEHQGKGIGKELLKHIFLQLKEIGCQRVFVKVLEDNQSRYFYEYYGANLLTTEKIKMADAELTLLTYEWDNIKKVLSKI